MSLDLLTLKSVVPAGYELVSAERFDLWTKMTELFPGEYKAFADRQDHKGLWKMGLRLDWEGLK